MPSPHLRYYAKTTWMIAAFRNLQIGKMRRRETEPRSRIVRNIPGFRSHKDKRTVVHRRFISNASHDFTCIGNLVKTHECVDLRNFIGQFGRKPLRHASTDNQFLTRSPPQTTFFVSAEDSLNRLL